MMAFAFCLIGLSMKLTQDELRQFTGAQTLYTADAEPATQGDRASTSIDPRTSLLVASTFYLSFLVGIAGFGVWRGFRWGFFAGAVLGIAALGLAGLAMLFGGSGGAGGLLIHAIYATYCIMRLSGRIGDGVASQTPS